MSKWRREYRMDDIDEDEALDDDDHFDIWSKPPAKASRGKRKDARRRLELKLEELQFKKSLRDDYWSEQWPADSRHRRAKPGVGRSRAS